jgi:hypothetical protein
MCIKEGMRWRDETNWWFSAWWALGWEIDFVDFSDMGMEIELSKAGVVGLRGLALKKRLISESLCRRETLLLLFRDSSTGDAEGKRLIRVVWEYIERVDVGIVGREVMNVIVVWLRDLYLEQLWC